MSASDMMLPAQLGRIKKQFDGSPGRPVIFVIGESHVSLPIQQAVADTISYLHGTYGVRLLCIEGHSGPLEVPARPASPIARRAAAESDFRARHISAVDYVALVHPDLRVIGVEDMRAYTDHGDALEAASKKWLSDFQKLLVDDVASLPARPGDADRLKEAFRRLQETGDLDVVVDALYEVVGRDSQVGKKLAALDELRKDPREGRCDHPLMRQRDRQMAKGVLSAAQAGGPVALVVGGLHLCGIERELEAAGTPFVSIFAAGVEEEMANPKLTPADAEVARRWSNGEKTPLEKWLYQHKPFPALARKSYRNQAAILSTLFHGAALLRDGFSEERVLESIRRAPLPAGFRVTRLLWISQGYGIEFTLGDERGYFYTASDPDALRFAPGFEKIADGKLGTWDYLVLADDGDGSNQGPPIPPVFEDSFDWDKDPSDRFYLSAIEKQERESPHAVTFRFRYERGQLVRWIGRRKRVLVAPPMEEILAAVQEFKEAVPGPEKVLAAQRLYGMVLPAVEEDMPQGRTVLFEISEDDFLGNVSLQSVAWLSGEAGSLVLLGIQEVYTISWASAQRDLEVLARPVAPVDIDRTTVWVSSQMVAANQDDYRAAIAAIEKLRAHVNERLPGGGTLILLHDGSEEGAFLLKDGTQVTATDPLFREAIQETGEIVAFNLALPQEVEALAGSIRSQTVDNEEAFALVRVLVEEIAKSSGRESLDRILRKPVAARRTELGEALTRESERNEVLQQISVILKIDEMTTRLSTGR